MADTPIIIKKKKGHGDHGHHGGSWKVAYADFVTAMMAFFMVMWIMGLSDETRAQIQGYFNDPLGFMKNQPKMRVSITPPGSPNAGRGPGSGKGNDPESVDEKTLRQLKTKLTKAMEEESQTDIGDLKKYVEITVTGEGLRIELVESTIATFFESGKATILPSAKHFIQRIGPLLASTKRPIVIEGHTDAMPYPSDAYNNWDLSADRANAMRRALQGSGVPSKQFIGVRAYADTELKRPDKPFDVSNRRVSLLLPFNKPKDSTVDLPRDEFEDRLKGKMVDPVEIAPN